MDVENIVGNNKIKKYLNEQITKDDILHSYLFSGVESIGKLAIAKEFAKDILCMAKKEKNCQCKSCISYRSENHPDFVLLNKEDETIKIEEIRNLINKTIEKPVLSKKKVYIINNSEKMTIEAQNCLLKTLEEPPEYAIIILITSNENSLLSTIKSRCLKLSFQPISDDDMKSYCNNVLEKKVDSDKIKLFNGSIGKAIDFFENENEYEYLEDLIEKMKKQDIPEIMQESKGLYNKEKIIDYLDFLIKVLYVKGQQDKKMLECIKYVNESFKKIQSNGNLDMSIDLMLIKIWEEVH